MRYFHCVTAAALLINLGCLNEDLSTTLVSGDPFGQISARDGAKTRASFGPAAQETAARVDRLGRQLLAANPQTNINPVFRTIGSPQPEIFHIRADEIDITEGLVRQCNSDGELAAILAHEVGLILAEREAITWPRGRLPERQPPQDVRIGNDSTGANVFPDLTRVAELAMYEKSSGPPVAARPTPPDAQALARTLLQRAGHSPADLDAVLPRVRAAGLNPGFEKQFQANALPRS